MATKLWAVTQYVGLRASAPPTTPGSYSWTLGAAGPYNVGYLDVTAQTGSDFTMVASTVAGPVSAPGISPYTGAAGRFTTFTSRIVSSQVTISGDINISTQGNVSNAAANATVRAVIWRWQPDGTISIIADGAYGSPLSTTTSTYNWTVTPTTTTLNPGDVITLTLYIDDAPGQTMATGYTATLRGGYTYLTSIEFAETVSFNSQGYTATGTTTRLLKVDSDVSGKKKLWTDTAGTSTTYSVNTVASPSINQWTLSAGGATVEWLTPKLNPATVSGPFTLTASIGESNNLANITALVRVYKTDSSGNNPVQVGQGSDYYEFSAFLASRTFYGHMYAEVAQDERLLVRLYTISSQAAQAAGYTGNLSVETTNTRIQWPTTLTTFVGNTVTLTPCVIEVGGEAAGAYEPASFLEAGVSLSATPSYETSVTTQTLEAGVAPISVPATITGGNTTANPMIAGVTMAVDAWVVHAPPPNDTPATADPIPPEDTPYDPDTGEGWRTEISTSYWKRLDYQSPFWTDQATYDAFEPGSVTYGTVWWTIVVGKEMPATTYNFLIYADWWDYDPQFAIYDSEYNQLAVGVNESIKITLFPGTYYIQGWTEDPRGDGLYLSIRKAPFALLNDTISPTYTYGWGAWALNACKVGPNTVLAAYTEYPDNGVQGLHVATAASLDKNMNLSVGSPHTLAVSDESAWYVHYTMPSPFHVGYGVCVVPLWYEESNVSPAQGEFTAHIVRVNTSTLDITTLGGISPYNYSATYGAGNLPYRGFGDGNGRGVFIGHDKYYWITATPSGWSYTTSEFTEIEDFYWGLVVDLHSGTVWTSDNKLITVDSVYNINWGSSIEYVSSYSWDPVSREIMGHVVSAGGNKADILIPKIPGVIYEYSIQTGVTAADEGATLFSDGTRWIDGNSYYFYDSYQMLKAGKAWIYNKITYTAPNTGYQVLCYVPPEATYSSKITFFDYLRTGITYDYEFGPQMIGLDNGTFICAWVGYTSDNFDSRAFFRGGCFPIITESPPLKLSQRDDDKMIGGARIGYQPENSGAIRAGRVAW